jgi:hypothetical protein
MIPETLITQYPDGASSEEYLQLCNPAGLQLITPELVQAAAHIPHSARAAFFTSIAGAVPTPAEPPSTAPVAERIAADEAAGAANYGQDANPAPTITDADKAAAKTGPMKWTAKAQADAKAIGTRLAESGADAFTDAEFLAFAESRRTTGGSVYANMIELGCALPPLPALSYEQQVGRVERPAHSENPDEQVLGPATWEGILPDGQVHRVTDSCCRWFTVRTDESRSEVMDVSRTRSEAAARIEVEEAQHPGGVWCVVGAERVTVVPSRPVDGVAPVADEVPGLAAGDTIEQDGVTYTVTAVDDTNGLLVAPEPEHTVADVFAALGPAPEAPAMLDAPIAYEPEPVPAAEASDPLAALQTPVAGLPPAPNWEALNPPSEPSPLPPPPLPAPAEPVYTYADFVRDFTEGAEADSSGAPDAAFAIDSMDRLGWYGRRLTALDAEAAELEASYKAAKAAITKKKGAFEAWFGPQARSYAEGILAADDWKTKSLKTLGGTFAFRSVPGGLRLDDRDALVAWARATAPELVAIKTTESVPFEAARQWFETNLASGNGADVPGGCVIADDRLSFSHKPAA